VVVAFSESCTFTDFGLGFHPGGISGNGNLIFEQLVSGMEKGGIEECSPFVLRNGFIG